MRIATAALVVLTLALSACGADAPPPPKATAAQPAQPLPDSNVFSADVKALQKAKDVQKTVDEQKKTQDKAIEDSGGEAQRLRHAMKRMPREAERREPGASGRVAWRAPDARA